MPLQLVMVWEMGKRAHMESKETVKLLQKYFNQVLMKK